MTSPVFATAAVPATGIATMDSQKEKI